MTSKAVRLANIKAKLDALDGEIEALKAAQKALNDTSVKVSYKPDKENVDNLKGKKYKEETNQHIRMEKKWRSVRICIRDNKSILR